jgi:hypothetical protein
VDLQRGDVGAGLVDAAKHPLQQEGVMVAKAADKGLLQLATLGGQPGPRQLGQDLGVALPAAERGQHGPAGDPEEVAGDHTQLDLGVLQQLVHPLVFGGPGNDQVGAVAGQVPQPADRRRGHAAGPQQLPLGDLGEPDRIQPVGLGPPGEVLDITRVDQPALKPLGVQQVERRLQESLVASITTRLTPSAPSRSASTSSDLVIVG